MWLFLHDSAVNFFMTVEIEASELNSEMLFSSNRITVLKLFILNGGT